MGKNKETNKEMKYWVLSALLLFSMSLFSQTYDSFVAYSPTYESTVESKETTISIKEDKNSITFYNATYDGEVTNLRIDSVKTKYWTYELGEVKTFFCTDLDEDMMIIVLDLINLKNTIKLIYVWDEISIEEYSFIVKKDESRITK